MKAYIQVAVLPSGPEFLFRDPDGSPALAMARVPSEQRRAASDTVESSYDVKELPEKSIIGEIEYTDGEIINTTVYDELMH